MIANLESSISESEKSLEDLKLKSIEAGKEYEELGVFSKTFLQAFQLWKQKR